MDRIAQNYAVVGRGESATVRNHFPEGRARVSANTGGGFHSEAAERDSRC